MKHLGFIFEVEYKAPVFSFITFELATRDVQN